MQKKILGIIGHPVGHTLSPAMHNRAAELLKVPYTYVAFDVTPESVKDAIRSLPALGIMGLNVTVPHKVRVIPFLDKLEEEAALIGAVNTITLNEGELTGANTDGYGFIRSLKELSFKPRRKVVSIVGAGGSARAIGVSLCRAGASEVVIINRTASRGKRLARDLSGLGSASFAEVDSPEAVYAIKNSDLVVQTTPCGMKKGDPLPIQADFSKGQLVYDIIYSPWKTRFLARAESKKAKIVNGLGMLVFQGSESFRLWTGKPFPEKKILQWMKRLVSRGR